MTQVTLLSASVSELTLNSKQINNMFMKIGGDIISPIPFLFVFIKECSRKPINEQSKSTNIVPSFVSNDTQIVLCHSRRMTVRKEIMPCFHIPYGK